MKKVFALTLALSAIMIVGCGQGGEEASSNAPAGNTTPTQGGEGKTAGGGGPKPDMSAPSAAPGG